MITYKNLGQPYNSVNDRGRLGNQLFQIAATIGVAIKNNDKAVFPKWEYSKYFKHPLEIEDINCENSYSDILMETVMECWIFKEILYEGNLNLDGYFQTEKYFSHCSDLIHYYYEPNDYILDKIKNKYENLLTFKTCSIHVRRGDYLTFIGGQRSIEYGLGMHDLWNHKKYYDQGLAYICNQKNVEKILVFSDDITWCKNNFSSDFVFIEDNSNIEDLFLMSMCKVISLKTIIFSTKQ